MSGAVPPPTARPLGGLPGPPTHWLWVRGGAGVGTHHQPHRARSCMLWGRHEGAQGGGASCLGVGRPGSGALPPPSARPLGGLPGPTTHWLWVRGGCGRGNPSPTPQRALLRAGFARCGGGTRAPRGGASCLGVGRPGSGALPSPTARPLGGLPGPTTHWLWVRGGAGVGTRHQPHSARSCELALRAVGAARGRPGGAPPAWVWGVRGRALSHPRLPALWADCRGPLPTGCGCGGVRAWGPVTSPTARDLASWLCALWGQHEGARGGRLLPGCGVSGVGRSPNLDCPPSGLAAGALYPLAVGTGGWGRGDPSPTPQRALLRAGFARCGGGMRVPGGGASCLGVGRPGSGALPPPTARPLGGLPGPTTHWLWVRGGCRRGDPSPAPQRALLRAGFARCGGGMRVPGGGRLMPGCGVSGVGRSPFPDCLPSGRAAGADYPLAVAAGGCGRGDPSPTPQRALLRAGFARCGGGTRAPGGGASCLGVGHPGSGALPPPTARPLDGLPGPNNHWLWVRGGAGVGTRHQPHSARSFELALRAMGAARGRPRGGAPPAWMWASGVGRSPTPECPPSGQAAGAGYPLAVGAGGCGRRDPSPAPQRALLRAGFARCGGGIRVPGGGPLPWVWGVQAGALSHPRMPALWAGCRGPLPTGCGCGGVRAWGPVTNPTARALASWLCALWGRHEGAQGGRLLPGCGASGVGCSPIPDCPPLDGLPGPTTKWLWVRGGAGVGTRHQPHSARSFELALRAMGAARGRPGGGGGGALAWVWASCVGRSPTPACPPSGRAPGAHYPLAVGAGGCGRGDPSPTPRRALFRACFARCGGGTRAPRGGRLLPGCGASGVGRSPTPDCPPSGRAAGAHYPLAVGAGGCGRGDPSPAPQRALLRAGFARCGRGMRVPGAGAPCLGVGRLGSGALPPLTARPLGGLSGPTTKWLWVRGAAGVGTRHQPHGARSFELALRAVGAARGRPGGGRLLPGCGASGVGRSPTPDCPPSGRAAGAHYPLAVGAGSCGRWDPSPAPQCALLQAGFARSGRGMRVPRGAAPCLGVGCPGSGALPPPTARPLGGLPGPTTQWLWVRGGAGVGTRHRPHSARSCELALRAVGAARGRPGGAPPALVWGVWGRALSHPRLPALWADCRGPLPTGCGCGGVRAWGPVTSPTARDLASWLCALWGQHEGARGGRLLPGCGVSGVGRSPNLDCPPSGLAAGALYPLAVGTGGWGRGDPSPTPQRALLRAGFARCGGGMRVPGGGASCLGVGRPGSGALPPPTARPLGGLPGPTTHWLWVRGECRRGDPSPAPQRALLRAGFARCGGGTRAPGGGASCLGVGCPGSGALPSPTVCGRLDPSPARQRALLRAGFARCGGGIRVPGGAPLPGVWGVQAGALSHPRMPALWAGCRGPLPTGCGCGGLRALGPVSNPTARALASWLCALWGRHEGAQGGRLLPGCGASGVGCSPIPDCPPSGRTAGAHYPLAVGAGGCGRGDPSPAPQRALLRAGFARCGRGMRVPGAGASCLGVGRLGSGALPTPTARPLGGLPGPTTQWLWVRGAAGVGTCHQPHGARSFELALRAVGAARGRPGGGASCLGVGRPGSGALPPPTARPLGGLPGPTTHWLWERGGAGVGTRHQPHSARSCELALRAVGGA